MAAKDTEWKEDARVEPSAAERGDQAGKPAGGTVAGRAPRPSIPDDPNPSTSHAAQTGERREPSGSPGAAADREQAKEGRR